MQLLMKFRFMTDNIDNDDNNSNIILHAMVLQFKAGTVRLYIAVPGASLLYVRRERSQDFFFFFSLLSYLIFRP